MIDDKSIDYKSEYNKTINKLVKLRQKYDELEDDRDYMKSLLDVEFEKRIKLQNENEQFKKENESMEKTLDKLIQLKETEIKQQRFFIELIEEVLPLNDSIKRGIHQRTIRSNIYD